MNIADAELKVHTSGMV